MLRNAYDSSQTVLNSRPKPVIKEKLPELSRAKVDILYSQNLIWIMWAIIFNCSFLISNITGTLFALDLLLGIGPIILNITYLSVGPACRNSIIPNGWPNVIFITCMGIIVIFFLGWVIFFLADCFAIKNHYDPSAK